MAIIETELRVRRGSIRDKLYKSYLIFVGIILALGVIDFVLLFLVKEGLDRIRKEHAPVVEQSVKMQYDFQYAHKGLHQFMEANPLGKVRYLKYYQQLGDDTKKLVSLTRDKNVLRMAKGISEMQDEVEQLAKNPKNGIIPMTELQYKKAQEAERLATDLRNKIYVNLKAFRAEERFKGMVDGVHKELAILFVYDTMRHKFGMAPMMPMIHEKLEQEIYEELKKQGIKPMPHEHQHKMPGNPPESEKKEHGGFFLVKEALAKGYHEPATAKKYVCPMGDPGVFDKPGTCPVCGVDLVAKEVASPTPTPTKKPTPTPEATTAPAPTETPAPSPTEEPPVTTPTAKPTPVATPTHKPVPTQPAATQKPGARPVPVATPAHKPVPTQPAPGATEAAPMPPEHEHMQMQPEQPAIPKGVEIGDFVNHPLVELPKISAGVEGKLKYFRAKISDPALLARIDEMMAQHKKFVEAMRESFAAEDLASENMHMKLHGLEAKTIDQLNELARHVDAKMHQASRRAGFIALFSLLLVLFDIFLGMTLAIRISRIQAERITAPVLQMKDLAERASLGEVEELMGTSVEVKTNDEIEEFGESFNRMLVSMMFYSDFYRERSKEEG